MKKFNINKIFKFYKYKSYDADIGVWVLGKV